MRVRDVIRGSMLVLMVSACGWAAARDAAPYTLEGQRVQGGLLLGRAEPGSKVWQDGQSVRVSQAGVFLLGFARDAPATSELRVVLPGGRALSETLSVDRREYRIQRIDGLPSAVDTKLTVDIAGVGLDRVQGEKQSFSNFSIGQTFGDELEHFEFAFAQGLD